MLTTPRAARLQAAFEEWARTRVDLRYLQSVGRVWSIDPAAPRIVPHARLLTQTDTAAQGIQRDSPQSYVVSGEPGSGKTTLVRAIAERLMANGWTIFECSAADVLSGQAYIGELEQRVKNLQDNLHAARKVLWYIPQFHELYYSGRHRFSPQGILDLLLPGRRGRPALRPRRSAAGRAGKAAAGAPARAPRVQGAPRRAAAR